MGRISRSICEFCKIEFHHDPSYPNTLMPKIKIKHRTIENPMLCHSCRKRFIAWITEWWSKPETFKDRLTVAEIFAQTRALRGVPPGGKRI